MRPTRLTEEQIDEAVRLYESGLSSTNVGDGEFTYNRLSPMTGDREYATRIRQRQKRLDENEIERLIAEYRTGLTIYQLATRFGCHRTTVSECLKARGIQMRRRPLCEEQIIEAIRLYQSGLSVAKVADQVGAKSETVRLRLIERGVQMRDSRGLARKHQDSTAEKTQLQERQ